MRCEDAYLSGEADIRAWGQQLGLQMGEQPLDLQPNILVSSGTGPTHLSDELSVKKYEATFILREVPESLLTKPERRSKYEEGLCLLWNTANKFKDEWKRFELRDLEIGNPRIRPI